MPRARSNKDAFALVVQGDQPQHPQHSPDLAGLIPAGSTSPPTYVESSSTPGLMERVARALVAEDIRAALEQGTPNRARALDAAGCNPAMYAQLATAPEWQTIMARVAWGYVVGPRYAAILLALTLRAMQGDAKAYKELMTFQPEGLGEQEAEHIDSMQKAGPERCLAELLSRRRQIDELIDRLQAVVEEGTTETVDSQVAALQASAAQAHARLAASPATTVDPSPNGDPPG